MQIGIIGLGRMGANMAARLVAAGHAVVAWDRAESARDGAAASGVTVVPTLDALLDRLEPPRVAWLMLPAGEPTESTLREVAARLGEGDVAIDGGNSRYTDSIRRAGELAPKGIRFLDVGTSGGVWGRELGYNLSVGGDAKVAESLAPVFDALAGSRSGWRRVGPAGAGHFVKMVHNGIEYGIMQAYAEGFHILSAKEELGLDLAEIAALWNDGSVIRSWLLELLARALSRDASLDGIAAHVDDSGEGRWTVAEAIDLDVPAPVITHSLIARLRSRQDRSYADRLLAALRNEFGGHAIKRS